MVIVNASKTGLRRTRQRSRDESTRADGGERNGRAARSASNDSQVYIPPFTIVVDNNEQAPYFFTGLRANANKDYRPILVQREKRSLETGDYSIKGFEGLVTVERKSLSDLFGTVGGGRERFREEHLRMQAMIAAGGYACVMIEASMSDVMDKPPVHSMMAVESVHRVSLSWPERYGVHWIWASNRRLAEESTFRLLEKFFEHREEEERAMKRAAKGKKS